MKTELIYLWINKDNHDCFKGESFNFSPNYSVCYCSETKTITLEKTDIINVFRDNNIANVTAIIGENGTGKTTLMEYITSLSDVGFQKEEREEYKAWRNEQNKLHEFIAVYAEHDGAIRIINITKHTIKYNELILDPYSNEMFRTEDYIGSISHIYLSNSVYDQNNNLHSDKIDHITITDGTLLTISTEFYHRKYGLPILASTFENTKFNALENMFASQENSQAIQMILDLIFYNHLSQEGKTFRGKHMDDITFCIKSTWKKIVHNSHHISYKTGYAEEKYIDEVEKKYKEVISGFVDKTIWSVIVCNLVFELLFVFDDFNPIINEEKSDIVNAVFEECIAFIESIIDSKEKEYYKEAIKEISIIKPLLENSILIDNQLPITDMGREVFAKTSVLNFTPWLEHIKTGYSFILKYIDIRNLHLSSGERALLNFMSRIYFASKISEYIPDSGFVWNESILLLIDEIDLYLHPEWQRNILSDLISEVKDKFQDKYVQFIIATHSPIVLSDIPKENSIFLAKNIDGNIIQCDHNIQTFGANIYTLYRDAFFIKNGMAMGVFAERTIQKWIDEIKYYSADEDEIKKKIALIGEPIIRKRVEKLLRTQRIHSRYESMIQSERDKMLDFLKKQQSEIQKQINILEGRRDDQTS